MRNVLNGLAAAIGRLWSKGCAGKAAVILGGLFLVGLCGSIVGGGNRAAAPSAAPTTAPPRITEVEPTKPPPPSPTAVPPATPTPAPTIAATETTVPEQAPPAATVAPRATQVLEPTKAPAPASFDRNGDGKVTCADFDTQAQAKKALDAGHKNLDNDGDGIPCESLPPG